MSGPRRPVRRRRRGALAQPGAARRAASPAHDRRGRRTTAAARARSPAAPARRAGPAVLGAAVGAAGHGQDDARPGRRRDHGQGLRADVGRHRRRQGRPRRHRAGPPAPRRARTGHDPVPRRDPPLQQGPAGRPAAGRGGRHAGAHRGDHGEPVLRGQPAAAEPVDAVPPATPSSRPTCGSSPVVGSTPSGPPPPTTRSTCSSSAAAATAGRSSRRSRSPRPWPIPDRSSWPTPKRRWARAPCATGVTTTTT